MLPPPPRSTLFPYTTLFRSRRRALAFACSCFAAGSLAISAVADDKPALAEPPQSVETRHSVTLGNHSLDYRAIAEDRKSTRLNSSHTVISYAVFCLKKKKKK